jgi:hypothetical protein
MGLAAETERDEVAHVQPLVQRYDRYEDILEQGIIPLMAKFLGRSR